MAIPVTPPHMICFLPTPVCVLIKTAAKMQTSTDTVSATVYMGKDSKSGIVMLITIPSPRQTQKFL
jgi:hypothetical protein